MRKKSKTVKVLLTIAISITVLQLALIIFFAAQIYEFLFGMKHLPEGDYLWESASPEGTYIIKVYLSRQALTSDAVRCELVYKDIRESKKNIYWEYKKADVTIDWKSDDVVEINGHILKLPNERYDWRRDPTFSSGIP